MGRLRRFSCVILSFVIVAITALGCGIVTSAATRIGYVNATGVRMRADAGTQSKVIMEGISYATVTVNGEKRDPDGDLWYNVTYKGVTGYLFSEYVQIIEQTADSDFDAQLKAFPSSYHNALKALHTVYPNWSFHADNVNLTLDEAVQLEITRKLIRTNYKSLLSMGLGAYDYTKNTWVAHDGNWYVASREVIKYYMDPRNFLGSDTVFSFMLQGYDPSKQTEAGVRKIVKGTFLDTDEYVSYIMKAAKESSYSPYVMASKILQEIGRNNGNSPFISGKYPGFEGYYNYFNINATGNNDTEKIVKALTYAKEHGWDTREKAIIGGAEFCSDGYIKAGQNTYYYMDFNIKNPNRIWHEYAGAIHDASSKGKILSSAYTSDKSSVVSFSIPVYKNTGGATVMPKENNNLNNYYFKTLSAPGLTPTYSMTDFKYEYNLKAEDDIDIVCTVPFGASYAGNSSFKLKKGANTVVLPVKSQSGYINDYTVYVESGKECTLYVYAYTALEDGAVYSGKCGENSMYTLNGNGTLIIYGSGATEDYKLKTLTPWYEYSGLITKIEISKNITRIGNNSFSGLTKVKQAIVNNPDMTFGYYVFSGDNDMEIYSYGNSTVEEYAKNNNIRFVKFENPDKPVAPQLLFSSGNAIILKYIDGYEYSIDGINWQSNNRFVNLKPETTYYLYQRIAEGKYAPSAVSDVLVVNTPTLPEAPNISRVMYNTVILEQKEGYEYSKDGKTWQASNVFSNVPFDKIQCFYQRAVNYEYELPIMSKPVKCLLVSSPSVLSGKTSIRVSPIPEYEYCLDDFKWQDSNEFTELIPGERYTVYQRPKNLNDVIVYNDDKTEVYTNGQDSIETPDASCLVRLKHILLHAVNDNNLAMDINKNGVIDICDLILLKKQISDMYQLS